MKLYNIYDKKNNLICKYYSKNRDVPKQFSSDEYEIEKTEESIFKATINDLINIPHNF